VITYLQDRMIFGPRTWELYWMVETEEIISCVARNAVPDGRWHIQAKAHDIEDLGAWCSMNGKPDYDELMRDIVVWFK
jgi:hypothetical protein